MAENNVIRIKNNFIDGLNKFNRLLTKTVFDVDSMKIVIDKYKLDGILIKKLFSYMYNYPWIIIYLNKYMNYLGIRAYDLIEFIKSYRYILLCNGVLDSRCFYYLRSTSGKDDIQMKIVNLLDKYFTEIFKLHFNYKELLFYYNLYLNGIITNQDIYEIDLLVNNNTKTIDLPDFKPAESNTSPVQVGKLIQRFTESSRGVDFINNEVYKKKLKICESCQYFRRGIVPFDGNIKDINNVDILIVNLNPDLNDFKEKRTFRESNTIRQNISKFPKDANWLLINLSPCAFKSKSEIGKDIDEIKEQLNGCNQVVLNFVQKNIKPKFIILIGQEVTSVFLPDMKFEDILGSVVDKQYIPVLHTNSMRNAKAQIRGMKCWESVHQIINKYFKSEKENLEKTTTESISKKTPEPESSKQIIVEKINKKDKLLLLDVKEIEGGKYVLLIFTDENGNKHYEKKRNTIPGYIKEANFKECGILTDSVSCEFMMTKMEKMKLSKLLREKMAKLKDN